MQPGDIRKVLVIKGPGIGDAVTAVPLMRNLKKFLGCEVHLFNEFPPEKKGLRLIAHCPYLDRLMRFDYHLYALNPRWGDFFGEVLTMKWIPHSAWFIRDVMALRREKYDLIIEGFPGTGESFLLSRLIGARYYACCSSNPQRKRYDAVLNIAGKNIIETENSLFETMGFSLGRHDLDLELFYDRDDIWAEQVFRSNGIKKNDRCIAITTGQGYKRWNTAKWADLLDRIDARVFCFGDRSQKTDLNIIIRGQTHADIIDLVEKTTIEQAATLMSRMDGFVGANGGLMWIAAALGVPSVVISGPTPYWWDPRMAHVTVLRKAGKAFYNETTYGWQQNARTDDVTVNDVAAALATQVRGVVHGR